MILALRVALAPLTILLASAIQRRLGPLRGGQIIGLPLTTGPFLIVLCLQYDPGVAARAAAGVVAGQMVVVGYCVAYGRLAAYLRPLWTLVVSLGAGAVLGAAVALVRPVWLAAAAVVALVSLALVIWPVQPAAASSGRSSHVDTGVRMAVAAGLVTSLSAAARIVGPGLAGTLSATPVILAVLGPATHRRAGATAVAELMRGALVSIPSAVVFVTVLAYALGRLDPVAAFGWALAGLVAAQALPWRSAGAVLTVGRSRPAVQR